MKWCWMYLMLNIIVFSFVSAEDIHLNQKDQAWVSWTDLAAQDSQIRLAYWNGKKWDFDIPAPSFVTKINYSPRLALDQKGQPWLIWVGEESDKIDIFVSHFEQHQWSTPEKISKDDSYEDTFPSISIDKNDKVYAAWVGQNGKGDEIFYSFYNGESWSSPVQINEEDDQPDVQPTVVASKKGIFVFWSGFDGNGYRLYGREWSQEKWSAETPLLDAEKIPVHEFPVAYLDNDDVKIRFLKDDEGYIINWKEGNFGAITKQDWKLYDSEILKRLEMTPGAQADMAWIKNHVQDHLRYVFIEKAMGLESAIPTLSGASQSEDRQIARTSFFDMDSSLWAEVLADVYICFGDSQTGESTYPGQLNAMIVSTYKVGNVLNFGKGGEKTTGGMSRLNKVLNSNPAELLNLLEGTNDISNGASAETTANNLLSMLNNARGHGLNAVIGTVPPRQDIYNDHVKRLNDAIINIAKANNYPIAEVYNFLASQANLINLYSDGYLHFTSEGDTEIAKAFLEAIKTIKQPPGGGGCGVSPVRPPQGNNLVFNFIFLLGFILLALLKKRKFRQSLA